MMLMLLSMVITLALVGFVLWVVVTYVPMPEPFRRAIVVLVVLVVVVWVIRILVLTSPGLQLLR